MKQVGLNLGILLDNDAIHWEKEYRLASRAEWERNQFSWGCSYWTAYTTNIVFWEKIVAINCGPKRR
jgi:hypothetical protein